MDHKDMQQAPDEQSTWVHDLLRRVPGEPIPEAARLRVLEALQVEQDLRESSDFNPDADVEDLVDLDARDQAFRASNRTPSSATDSS